MLDFAHSHYEASQLWLGREGKGRVVYDTNLRSGRVLLFVWFWHGVCIMGKADLDDEDGTEQYPAVFFLAIIPQGSGLWSRADIELNEWWQSVYTLLCLESARLCFCESSCWLRSKTCNESTHNTLVGLRSSYSLWLSTAIKDHVIVTGAHVVASSYQNTNFYDREICKVSLILQLQLHLDVLWTVRTILCSQYTLDPHRLWAKGRRGAKDPARWQHHSAKTNSLRTTILQLCEHCFYFLWIYCNVVKL